VNLLIITVISLVFLFINDSKSIYQASISLLVLIGLFYFFKTKNKKLFYIEKFILSTFSLYFITYLIFIFNDPSFSIRDIDHVSRFILLIPLYFIFRQIKSYIFLEKIIVISSLFTSIIVITNFAFFDIDRSYSYSCISGAQVSLVLGLITFFTLLGKKNLKVIIFLSLVVLFSFASVFLSETRGVILCIPFGFLIVFYLKNIKLKLKYIIYIFSVFFTISFIAIQTIPSLNSRFHKTVENCIALKQSIASDEFHGSTSITIRYNFIKYGYLAFLENPLFGSGRNGFAQKMVELGYDEKYLKTLSHCHNQFVSDLAMRGLFGFLSTLLFMLILTLIFLALRKHGEKQFSSYGIILMFAYFMFFFTDSPFIGSMHATLFFIFCCFLFFSASLNNLPKK
jgi:O-antigen ligase